MAVSFYSSLRLMNSVNATCNPLSIAVIGVGGIGSAFAHRLVLAGHDVTVVARPGSARLKQLQRDKGFMDDSATSVEMRVADTLDDNGRAQPSFFVPSVFAAILTER